MKLSAKKKYLALLSSSRRFARTGLLSGAMLMAILGSTQPAAANSQRNIGLFFKNGFGYCDARKLGKLWGESAYAAKATAGGKLASFADRKYITSLIIMGAKIFRRAGMSCGRSSLESPTQFTYRDANRVAALWSGQEDQSKS